MATVCDAVAVGDVGVSDHGLNDQAEDDEMTRNARRTRWAKPAIGTVLIGALAVLPVLTGCAGVETANAADATLVSFTSCAALTKYAQGKALERVGPYGLGGGPYIFDGGAAIARTGATTPSASLAAAEDQAAAPKAAGVDFSTTNVQEAGVDEPDVVKSDGNRIFAIAKNRLYAVDVSGPTPRIVGSLAMPTDTYARDMLISADKLIVMSDGPVDVRPVPQPGGAGVGTKVAVGAPDIAIGMSPGGGGSVITEIDATDAAAMKVLETFQTEARYVTARMSGTTARIVVAAGGPMGITFAYPNEPGDANVAKAGRSNRNVVSRTTADNWIPRYSVTSAAGTSAPRPLVACDAVSRPPVFSGLDTLTVLTIDVTHGLDPIDADAVMASGENVYASSQSLYVATNRQAIPDAQGNIVQVDTTQIHKFDTSSSSQTTYSGSGTVIGQTLNQFSMSELDGKLRIATTDAGLQVVGGDAVVDNGGQSQSYVTVLDEHNDKLRQLGQVGGLGKGERIFAVRFIGTTAYVVTFKQTDPLYTIDLSDPAAPRVVGELKIAGYSAYLHPIGDNLLIGVGQDANEQGRTQGLQVSLFDVSDPASPKRIQNAVLPGANSDAEWDHHAFLWWPATNLAVVPFQLMVAATDTVGTPGGRPAPGVPEFLGPVTGALGMRVTRDGISEAGRVIHPNDPQFFGGVKRSLVVGDTLFTLSDGGLKASGLDDLAERAWLPFA